MPKMHWHWLKFVFQLPKDLVLELLHASNLAVHIPLEASNIWLSFKFAGQILMHRLRLRSTIIFP